MMTFKRKQILEEEANTQPTAHARFNMTAFKMAADVFSDKELLHVYFRDCFTAKNFAFNKAARRSAAAGHLHIKPVAVRENIDFAEYRQYLAGDLAGKLRVCDMQWPRHLDPTAKIPAEHLLNDDGEKPDVVLMTEMLRMNAPHIRRLLLCMSLAVEIDYLHDGVDVVACPDVLWPYSRINSFLHALSLCGALEELSITQTDYVAKSARTHSVQVKVMEIVKDMERLSFLYWNGNMTEQIRYVNGRVAGRLTICEYLPPSLEELRLEDGDHPRYFPWNHIYNLSATMGRMMSQLDGGNLRTLILPLSFWSLSVDTFGFFIQKLNDASHIDHIGISDDFKLNEGPVERILCKKAYRNYRRPNPVGCFELLVKSILRDMTIDLGACDDAAERAERMTWAESLKTYGKFFNARRDDGEEFTTFTFSRIIHEPNESTFTATIKVLI
jgi:hypothetical protein